MFTLDSFYRSKEWQKFRNVVINERMQPDGFVYDEITGKPIVNAYDIILHHTIFLTEENVNDVNISLNPELIQIVSHRTHNRIHNKLGHTKREIFLVYGAPFSGKTYYVENIIDPGDLVIDINNIWNCVTGMEHIKPSKLNSVVFNIRNNLLDCVKHRLGRWDNCYIVGGYPLISERERLCKELGAREIFIDTPKEICIQRLSEHKEYDFTEYSEYIEDWFRKFFPNIPPVDENF